jgi:DNA invertase Pin-like site-specific DNA recombinase
VAKAAGAYKGRKPSLTQDKIEELKRRALAGEKKTVLAKEFGVSRETVYSYLAN